MSLEESVFCCVCESVVFGNPLDDDAQATASNVEHTSDVADVKSK